MADYTQNCNLILPAKSENYDVETANTNNQIIDTQLGNKMDKVPGKGPSTNDFTNNYKNKLDTLQNIYRFIEAVDTTTNLPSSGQKNGDVYNVRSENKDYAWSDTTQQWVELGSATNLDNVATKEEVNEKVSEINSNIDNSTSIQRTSVTLESTVNASTNYTIPLSYQVGNDSLEVYYCGSKLAKGVDYNEVGTSGEVSNVIQFLDNIGDLDMSGVEGFENFTEMLEFTVRGDYSAS